MKTQISRNSFKAKKRYSGVYQQQGRMLTDADWNNLVDVLKGHLAEALKDVVGTGSPREGELAIDADDLTIIPGDLYVDGLRSSLPDPGAGRIPVTDQPDFPEAPALPDPAVDPYVVYADVWERSLTALEDPDLRDAGLNGADTGTRTQSMLQVKICPENVDPEKEIPQHGDAALSLTLHGSQTSGDPCDPCAGQVDAGEGRIGNYLFRVEVHRFEGTAADPTRLTLKWSSENGAEQYEAQDEPMMPPGFVDTRYMYEFFDLTTEQHAGVHLAPGFSPTSGILKTDYFIPAGNLEPKDFVRRWDGYCELVYSGSAWSLATGWDKGVDLPTGVAGPILSIKLEALHLELDLTGARFVAGDYWLAPVREAEHVPGDVVIKGAPPEGIVHHYLRLARVVAGGTVSLYDDDADRRRHSFPLLTDLRAPDVGYETDCSSGLFDASHDNVEKALNQLCKLAADHIHYEADCGHGLFQNFIGTVKEALDEVCAIQAADVGFSKPCDTGFYRGQTVTTVADALGLLCDTQTGGCKVTVGEGGVFNTLEEALNELLNGGQSHICLCLLPGKHMLPGQVIKAPLAGVHLCLSGCGSCTRLYVEQAPAHFSGFDVLCLSAMEIITRNVAAGALIFENCRDVSLRDASVFGFTADDSLIEVRGARAVTMHDLLLEASGPESLEKPGKFLDLHPALTDLYKLADRTVFDNKATEAAKELAALDEQTRQTLGETIDDRAIDPAAELAPRERKSYRELAEQLGLPSPDPTQIDAALRSIRLEAVRMRPTVALAIMDAGADWSLRDCDILGIIMFHGSKPSGPLPVNLTNTLDTLVSQGSVTFVGTTAAFKAFGCRATRIDISAGLGDRLENIVAQKGGVIDGLFTTGMLSDCTLVAEESQLAVLNTNISSTVFEVANTRAALVMGESSIYVGNRGGGETVIVNITSPNRTERAANLQLDISA